MTDFSESDEAQQIDLLYRQALEAMEAVEWLSDEPAGESPAADASSEPVFPRLADLPEEDEESAGLSPASGPPSTAAESSDFLPTEFGAAPRGTAATPRQVIEAALFVGGESLSTRRLCGLLRGEFTPEFVEDTLEDLNRQYLAEGRPYEMRLGEGGYRMQLRADFDPVRNRVFGLGPKEVKLSQEALEVLALVAYRQPISREEIERLGKSNAGGLLNQLLRRELIALERDGKQVRYRTAPRFLQVFGLSHLNELPQAEELHFK